MSDSIVISGALAQRPGRGGHTWVLLQYILGLKRLGWDVLFLDRLEPGMSVDRSGVMVPVDASHNLSYFLEVMSEFGLQEDFSIVCSGGTQFVGRTRSYVLERLRSAAFLLNIMGYLTDEELLGSAAKRVFLDIDPGFGQMWHHLNLADVFRGHDDYVTIGENIGRSDCTIPTCGIEWITTPQPVVLDYWPVRAGAGEAFTSIGTWRGPYSPIEYRGKTYGLRVHEFRKFAPLPRLSRQAFEVALDIHAAEANDLTLLADNEWVLVDPRVVARDPRAYQDYIGASKAEFMVAKNIYVQSNSGWFSDRSICYLASGRPVLAQDTGIRRLYPTGEGLVTFATIEEALAGVESISRDYDRHARAARALAEEFFDSNKVLGDLLNRLGVI